MNEKEIAELRRRFRAEKSGIARIRGCFVNESREVISRFDQSLGLMRQEESERLLAVLRKTLTGTLGKNLLDIAFATRDVAQGEEHRLLMTLRSSRLTDEDAVETLYRKLIDTVDVEGNYLILLVHDDYDVPYRAKDGARQDDASSEVYTYILCSVCPVKLTRPALSYYVHQNEFHNLKADWVVSAPELGFLFPAFDERSANLYGALYYSRDITESHEAFVDAVFHTAPPMPAAAQKETFQNILQGALAEDCRYEVVQAVQDQFCALIEEHREGKEAEPLKVSKGAVKCVLKSCGVSESHLESFDAKYDDEFGADAGLSPRNLVDTKQLEVRTPDVTIRVNPERSDLVETRTIDGARYILIRADEGVEVNGVNILI